MPQVRLTRIMTGGGPAGPILIGSSADESRLVLWATLAGEPLREQNGSNETIARMAALEAHYANAFPDLLAAERHRRRLTAEEYGMPCLRIAERHAARGGAVYRYRRDYSASGGPFAGHRPYVIIVPFTFDHRADPGFTAMFGSSAADQPLADNIHGAVAGFVRDGRPETAALAALATL